MSGDGHDWWHHVNDLIICQLKSWASSQTFYGFALCEYYIVAFIL